jgi:hypothetical protein
VHTAAARVGAPIQPKITAPNPAPAVEIVHNMLERHAIAASTEPTPHAPTTLVTYLLYIYIYQGKINHRKSNENKQ